MNENFFIDSSFFCFDLFLSHSFSLLSWFCCSRPFQNNHMHCEIVDNYLTYLLLKCNWKKKTWKIFFGCPNWLISLPNSLNTSLVYIQTYQVFFIGKQFQSPRHRPLPSPFFLYSGNNVQNVLRDLESCFLGCGMWGGGLPRLTLSRITFPAAITCQSQKCL